MCMPSQKVPAPPPPPAQRQAMKPPETRLPGGMMDAMRRRRGYAALMAGPRPSLQAPPTTTSTLGG